MNPIPTSDIEDEFQDGTQDAQATADGQEGYQGACVRTKFTEHCAVATDDVTHPNLGSMGRSHDPHIVDN